MNLDKYIEVREKLSPRAETVADREAGIRFSEKRFKDRSEWTSFKTRVYLEKMDDLVEERELLR
jgi:hypothetical protein